MILTPEEKFKRHLSDAIGARQYLILEELGYGLPHLTNTAAMALFLKSECHSDTAEEIRKELKYLNEHGLFSWAHR